MAWPAARQWREWLLIDHAGFDGGAQHFAYRRDPFLRQHVDQAVHFVPGGHTTK